MKRRKFIKGAGVAGLVTAAAVSSFPKPAIAQSRVEINMVTTWPRDFPGLGTGAQRLAKRLDTMTEGRIKVNYFAAGERVGAFDSFDEVASGNSQAYHAADYYWKGKHPGWAYFTSVPFGLTYTEMNAWIRFGGGQQLWDELAGTFGIKAVMAGNTGHQMGGWFRKEINTLDDLVGLKMRIPGQGGDVLRALGGSSVALPGGEIYQSLQTGAIDATEWVGPWNDYYLGFHREAPYYYGPGFHEPGASLAVGMNLRVWDGLTLGEQQIIKAACESVNHTSLGEFTYQNAVHLDLLKREHGVQMRSFAEKEPTLEDVFMLVTKGLVS